jgi:hypothetical protein
LCDKAATIIIVKGEEDHSRGALMTGVVVTATDGAEHRRTKMAIFITHHHAARLLQLPQVACHGVPNGELRGCCILFLEENAAVAAVQHSVLPM